MGYVWEILGIEPTDDERIIRHAYASMTQKCHPEDAPIQFQRLHNAYEQAIRLARLGDKSQIESASCTPCIVPQYNFDELIARGLKEHEKIQYKRSKAVMNIILTMRFHSRRKWEKIIQSDTFQQIQNEANFMNELAIFIDNHPWFSVRLKDLLYNAYHFELFEKIADKGIYSKLFTVLSK